MNDQDRLHEHQKAIDMAEGIASDLRSGDLLEAYEACEEIQDLIETTANEYEYMREYNRIKGKLAGRTFEHSCGWEGDRPIIQPDGGPGFIDSDLGCPRCGGPIRA